MSDNKLEQLLMLKELTKTTGGLHDAQLLQLRTYVLVIADNVKDAEASIDINKKTISYSVTFSGKTPDKLRRRAALLAENVQFLLGSDWGMVLKTKETTYRFPAKIKNGPGTKSTSDKAAQR